MDRLRQDVRFTLRALQRSPAFTLTVLATLAIGIGANTAIFSFVDAVLLRPLPYADPGRIVTIWQDYSRVDGPEREWFTPPDFEDVRAGAKTLSAVTVLGGFGANLTGMTEPIRLNGGVVSPEWFAVLGVQPALGRAFDADDAAAGGVVVLSHGVWRSTFGGDAGIVGRTIQLNGQPSRVLGVMPEGFTPPVVPADLWSPPGPQSFAGCGRGCYVLRVMARVADGATLEQARAEVAAIGAGILERFPAQKQGLALRLVPLHELITGPVRPALLALLGAVGLLLLIACVNIANLLLARAGGREREVSIRAALGAGRGRIVRQLLTEAVILGALGGLLGVLVALWGVRVLVGMSPPGTPRLDEVGMDVRVLAFAALISVATGILFGLAPAVHLSGARLTTALREGLRTTGARQRLRGGLVVLEIALALMLLIGAGLLVRSFGRLQSVDPGFRPANVLTVQLLMPRASYPEPAGFNAFFSNLLASIAAKPGVEAAGLSSILPLSGSNTDVGFIIEGKPLPQDRTETPTAWYRSVTADYFRALGMRLQRGRAITAGDRADAPAIAVVNETFARRYFAEEDPIGKRISVSRAAATGGADDSEVPWMTIVGVVADVRHSGLALPPLPEMYLPHEQLPARGMALVVRTAGGDPIDLVATIRAEVRALDPDLPLGAVGTMDEAVRNATALPRLYLSFFAFFAIVALVLAAVGIYGVTSYTVAQRTREIGIRMALGAEAGDVLRLVLREGALLAAAGVGIGMLAALALSRTLRSLLFDLSPTDPLTFALIPFVLSAVTLIASALPAGRAARVDPLVALRNG